jgi:hypothetical protein
MAWQDMKNVRFYIPSKYINTTTAIQYFTSEATSTDYKITGSSQYFSKDFEIEGNTYTFENLYMANSSNYTLANFKKQTLKFIFRDGDKSDYTLNVFNNLKLFYSDKNYVAYEVPSEAYSCEIDTTSYANYYRYTITIDCSKLGDTFYNCYSSNFTPLFVLPLGYNTQPIIMCNINVERTTGIITSKIPSQLLKDTSFSWDITTLTGYKISSFTCTDSTITCVISDDKRSATITGTITSDIKIVMLADTYSTYKIFNEISNTSIFTSQTQFEDGDPFNIKVTVKEGYAISWITCNQIINNITIADDKKSAIITGKADSNIYLYGEALQNKYVTITGSFDNCHCNYSNNELVNIEKNIIITANTGYEFLNDSYTCDSDDGTITFNKSFDNTTLTITISEHTTTSIYGVIEVINYTLNGVYKATKTYSTVNQFVSSYAMSPLLLAKLAKSRYGITTSDSDGNESTTYFDYGSYITSLYKHPIDLQYTDFIESNIILGLLDTKIATNIYTTDYIDYSLGSIEVKGVFNDYRDYSNSYILHCPFMDNITLEGYYVINQTLQLQARFNLYKGTTTVKVFSSFNNLCVLTHTFDNSTHIPFIQSETSSTMLTYSSNVIINDINKAFIECIHSVENEFAYTKYQNETYIYDTIGLYKGYTVINDIDFIGTITTEELEDLQKILKQGVIINE